MIVSHGLRMPAFSASSTILPAILSRFKGLLYLWSCLGLKGYTQPMIVSPGLRMPAFSASSTILKAILSLTLPPALKNSHLATLNIYKKYISFLFLKSFAAFFLRIDFSELMPMCHARIFVHRVSYALPREMTRWRRQWRRCSALDELLFICKLCTLGWHCRPAVLDILLILTRGVLCT